MLGFGDAEIERVHFLMLALPRLGEGRLEILKAGVGAPAGLDDDPPEGDVGLIDDLREGLPAERSVRTAALLRFLGLFALFPRYLNVQLQGLRALFGGQPQLVVHLLQGLAVGRTGLRRCDGYRAERDEHQGEDGGEVSPSNRDKPRHGGVEPAWVWGGWVIAVMTTEQGDFPAKPAANPDAASAIES